MIIAHWSRNSDIQYISSDIVKLLITYSEDIITDIKPKQPRSPSYQGFNFKSNVAFGRRKSYKTVIRNTLHAVLCLTNCYETAYHTHSNIEHPNVELRIHKEFLLNPLIISRNDDECCLIEGSMNSVRISFKLKCWDSYSEMDTFRMCRFLQARASLFGILRKRPMKNYDISWLITNKHITEEFDKYELIDFILDQCIDMLPGDTAGRSLFIARRCRLVAKSFMQQFI